MKKYGFVMATLVSSIAFGLMHQNLEQFIFATIMGIIFCLVNRKADSMLPSIIIHFLNNSIAYLQLVVQGTNLESLVTTILGIVILLAIAIATVSIIYMIYLKLKKVKIFEKEKYEILKVENPVRVICTDFVTVMTIITYVIFTLYITILL